jgi:hypothetical protein
MRHEHSRSIALLAAIALTTACGSSAGDPPDPSVALETVDEVFDGTMNDLAGPPSSADPDNDRVWLAQGLYRTALRVSDAQRIFAEDATFPPGSATEKELVCRLEYGPTRRRLYTLTSNSQAGTFSLYCEDASVPSAPVLVGTPYTFPDWTAHEPVIEFKLWEDPAGDDDILVALTPHRVLVLRFLADRDPSFELLGAANDLIETSTVHEPWFHDQLAPSDPRHIDPLHAIDFVGMKLQEESAGRLMAYVRTAVDAYSSNPAVDREAAIVMICDLDEAHFATGNPQPTFDAPSGGRTGFVFFNPLSDLPTDSSNSDDSVFARTVHDAFPYTVGASHYLYVACGSAKQVQRVDVTRAFEQIAGGPEGCCFPLDSQQIDVVPDVDGEGGEDVVAVFADPNDPDGRFFAGTPKNFHIWSRSHFPPVLDTLHEPFDKGCGPDIVYLSILGGPLAGDTLWTVGGRAVDHMGKVFDVTRDTLPIDVRQKYFGIYANDGAVAFGDDVYLTTFNGVELYQPISTNPFHEQVVQTGSQSTEAPIGSGHCAVTEALEPGHVPGATNPDRAFSCDATGAFCEFQIDPATLELLPARRFVPDASVVNSATDGWSYSYPPSAAGIPVYSNDVAFADLGPEDTDKWVLVDLSNYALPAGDGHASTQVMLLAYQWDPTTSGWVNRAAASMTPIEVGQKVSNAICVTQQGGTHYAVVCHGAGLDVFEIERLRDAVPHMTWWPDAAVRPGADILGVAIAGDHVFVPVPGVGGHPPRIETYVWSGSDPHLTLVRTISEPTFVDRTTGAVAHPGTAYKGRAYLRDDGVTWDVLFGCDSYVLQFSWTPPGDGLVFLGHWRSFYSGPIADCRMFDFPSLPGGKKILAVKSGNAFAIIEPVQ